MAAAEQAAAQQREQLEGEVAQLEGRMATQDQQRQVRQGKGATSLMGLLIKRKLSISLQYLQR